MAGAHDVPTQDLNAQVDQSTTDRGEKAEFKAQTLQSKADAQGDLIDTISTRDAVTCEPAAKKRGPQLTAEIEASTGKLDQLKEDVKAHQIDCAAAKYAMAEATSLPDNEKAAFDSAKRESQRPQL